MNILRPEQCHISPEWISSRRSYIVKIQTRKTFDDLESLRTSHHSVENHSCRGRRSWTFSRTVLWFKKPAESLIDLTKRIIYIQSVIRTPKDVSNFVQGTDLN